ncbi:hypothetical protein [Castellaniella sp. UC4442_H9]
MAINLDDRYPGRANGKTLDYPQGSFKNRTSPTSKDGTYLEQDWANDQLAFFQAMLAAAGLTANGTVDTAQASQYFDALKGVIDGKISDTARVAAFAELDAMASDQGPIICTDMGGYLYKWTTSPYFTGYRNVRCGNIPTTFAASPRAWEASLTGGVWSMADPKQKRLIAWFQEQGKTVPSANWIKGQGMIADLGSGNWKAPDEQDMFWRVAGTDADTANARLAGAHQNDALQNVVGTLNASNIRNGVATGAFAANLAGAQAAGSISDSLSDTTGFSFDPSRVARTSVETRGSNTAVAPVILI